MHHDAIHCNTPQPQTPAPRGARTKLSQLTQSATHSATDSNAQCNILQRTEHHNTPHCNTLQHTSVSDACTKIYSHRYFSTYTHYSTLQNTVARCHTLHHPWKHRNTTQHTSASDACTKICSRSSFSTAVASSLCARKDLSSILISISSADCCRFSASDFSCASYVYVCVCVCVRACVCVFMYICMCVHVYVNRTWTRSWSQSAQQIAVGSLHLTFPVIHVCMRVCMYVRVRVCVYMYICMCVYKSNLSSLLLSMNSADCCRLSESDFSCDSCMHMCVPVCVCACVCVYMYICMCVYESKLSSILISISSADCCRLSASDLFCDICMYVFVYVCACVCVYVYMHVCICAYQSILSSMLFSMSSAASCRFSASDFFPCNLCVPVCVCVCACVRVRMCVFVCIRIYVCVCVCASISQT